MVPHAQAEGQEIESTSENLNRLRRKNPLKSEGDYKILQQDSLMPPLSNKTRLLEGSRGKSTNTTLWDSNRPFEERGVASDIRKAGPSTAQGFDRLTVFHFHYPGPYD